MSKTKISQNQVADDILNACMPSNTYIDLSIPASGTVLTAPADGYVMARQEPNGRYSLGSLVSSTDSPENLKCFQYDDNGYAATIPVKKGDYFVWYYFSTATKLRFIYAIGSESEYTPS